MDGMVYDHSKDVYKRQPYMLGVAVGLPDEGDARLVAARQVMSLVLQHLP